MRICPKCSKRVLDESKICRDCGAILEDVPAPAPSPGQAPIDAPRRPRASPGSGGPPAEETAPAKGRTSPYAVGIPPAARPGATGPTDQDLVLAEAAGAPPPQRLPDWRCLKCGEMVPGTFDWCWNCSTGRNGEQDPGLSIVTAEVVRDHPVARPEAESAELEALARPVDAAVADEAAMLPAHTHCPRCGSTRLLPDVTVTPPGQSAAVLVSADPDAGGTPVLLSAELRAEICGYCGHVEWRVADPADLYRRYRASRATS